MPFPLLLTHLCPLYFSLPSTSLGDLAAASPDASLALLAPRLTSTSPSAGEGDNWGGGSLAGVLVKSGLGGTGGGGYRGEGLQVRGPKMAAAGNKTGVPPSPCAPLLYVLR